MNDSDSDTSEEEIVDHHTLKKPEDQLLAAAVNNDDEFIKKLLDDTPSLVNYKDHDGYTVLHRAAYSEHPKVLALCLDYIPSENASFINVVTNDGWSPLHSASRWNSFACVKLLLDKGADVNLQSNGGHTPLHLAAEFGDSLETLSLLLNHPNINTEIINSNGETALQIAKRQSKYAYLFDQYRKAKS